MGVYYNHNKGTPLEDGGREINAKDYLEYKIEEIKEDIERAEKEFERMVNSSSRNYTGIIRQEESIKSLQDELKGMETAIDVMRDFEEE